MMLEDEELDRHELLAEGNARAAELATLVERLLYFSEIMDGSWSTSGRADLHGIQEELTDRFSDRYPSRKLEFEWRIDERARFVGLPQSRLRVVLDNLLDNAVKFTDSEAVFARVRADVGAHGVVEISVEDRGCGIPETERDRIFESFYQGDTEFTGSVQGAGLGLPIVTEIVHRVGGTLSVGEAEPNGAVFSFTVPARIELREERQDAV
jgi:signal transduction histidine kinase